MKADPEVKMISAEAPILFAKGCDIFITELTMRAWIHAEENKRRTLQRSDIASALAKSDMFDFLIDIVPREEALAHSKRSTTQAGTSGGGGGGGVGGGGGSSHHHQQAASTSGMATQQQQTSPTAPPTGAAAPGNAAAVPSQQRQPSQHHSHPPQQQQQQPPPHHMAGPPPPEYGLGPHGISTEQDYRAQPGIYSSGPVHSSAAAAAAANAYTHQQPQQMYGEMEGMYGYPTMPPQQVCMVISALSLLHRIIDIPFWNVVDRSYDGMFRHLSTLFFAPRCILANY